MSVGCWSAQAFFVSLIVGLGCRTQVESEPPSVAIAEPPSPSPTSEPVEQEPAAEPESQLPAEWIDAAARIAAAADGDTTAWTRLAKMVDAFGHRLSGSKSLESAIDWSLEVMRGDGLHDVHREPVMVPHWVRGEERARVIGGRELQLLGLGGTVGTGRRPLRAPVMVVASLEELEQRAAEAKGKIVVINQAMPPYSEATRDPHYGPTVGIRVRGPSAAARVGAKALLIRSVTAHSLRSPHTGSLHYEDGVPKIPAAALSVEDAEHLARLAARGSVSVELSLGAKTLPDALSGNAIGDYRGTELPDEIVVIGGHIDSWDVGDGSSDDGSGCLMAIEAVRLLAKAGLRPRRTIRVVLFTNEENGLRGGIAYHKVHGAEKHVAAIEADVGSGAPWGFSASASDEEFAVLESYGSLLRVLGASGLRRGGGGADISPLTKDGVLSLGLFPDISHYFDLHHSDADTIDKIDPAHLEGNAAALALMAYMLADRP